MGRAKQIAVYASIFCATLIAYLPALHGTFLWDDDAHITRPDLQSLHGLWRIWFDLGATQQYYPFLHSAFWLEHRIWGDAALGYHLTNILLHAVAACLVVLIVRKLELPGTWLAGLCFALHPVCVEAVAWISEQKSTLSAVFYLGAALAYLRFDESRRASRYLPALILFVLALLTKTVTATLPAALLVVLWWKRGRLAWKQDVRPLAPLLALGAAAGLFTAWMESTYIGATFALSFIQRCLLAARALWFYASKLVWPVSLAFTYPRWKIDPGEWWQYSFVAGAVALAVGLAVLARRRRGPLAAFLIFAGTLFPALGFFNVYPFRYSWVADHFQYLATLGIIVPVMSTLAVGTTRRVAGTALLAILGILTWRQSGIYRDPETLYRATLHRNPESWLEQNNLGNLLLEIPGRRAEAVAHLEAARRIEPDYSETHLSLGNALIEEPGRLVDAVAEYQAAVRLAPESERAHSNLGRALLRAGLVPEAVAELQAALRIKPDYAEAHNNLGNARLMRGHLAQAIAEYEAALAADPNLAQAHNNLGRALAQIPGRLPDAIAQFEAAIRLDPGYWGAHSNLGNALSEVPGRLPDAIAEYQAALRINPEAAEVHNNLGYALSQMPGRLPDAIAEYQAALRIAPDFANAQYNLRAAQARLNGR